MEVEKVNKRLRIFAGIRWDPDTLRLARIHRANTGENMSDLVNRLVRSALAPSNGHKPAA